MKPPLRWGDRVGRWKVIGPDKDRKYHTMVLCCCGKIQSVQTGQLKAHRSNGCKSCSLRGNKRGEKVWFTKKTPSHAEADAAN